LNEEVVQIVAGGFHTLAISKSGLVYAWGDNSHNQLGQIEALSHLYITFPLVIEQLVGIKIIQLIGGEYHSFAVTGEGRVFGFGSNIDKQLGMGNSDTIGILPEELNLILLGSKRVNQVATKSNLSVLLSVVCKENYFGHDCSQYECYLVNYADQSVCSNHGNCVSPNNCSCSDGYTGRDCSIPLCFGTPAASGSVCSNNGRCDSPNSCTCKDGYAGELCELTICYGHLSNETQFVCSGTGRCASANDCVCNYGFSGTLCNDAMCYGKVQNSSDVCSGHGKCSGLDDCECINGYSGETCNLPICFEIPKSTGVCSGHGDCYFPNSCNCTPGYGGEKCDIPYCFGISGNETFVCSSYGTCIAPGQCICNSFRYGKICEQYSCNGKDSKDTNACSAHGVCINMDNCTCDSGYTGQYCQDYSCHGQSNSDTVCSGHGRCVGVDKCECNTNFIGALCNLTYCDNIASNDFSVCSGRGNCTLPNDCKCREGYVGTACQYSLCYSIQQNNKSVCSGHGECTAPNTCACESDKYIGNKCDYPKCFSYYSNETGQTCSGHGICIGVDKCKCDTRYTGEICSVPICHGKKASDTEVCSNNGDCIAPDECKCHNGYDGKECNVVVCNNIKSDDKSNVCNGRGSCDRPERCTCYGPYFGDYCDKEKSKYAWLAVLILFPLLCCLAFAIIPWYVHIKSAREKKKRDDDLRQKLMMYELGEDTDIETEGIASTILIDIKELEFKSRISEGASGVVYKGLYANQWVAIKRLKIQGEEEAFIREASLLNSLRHPNILQLFGYSSDKDQKYIITEFMANGSVDKLIYDGKLKNFSTKLKILLHISHGMSFLHGRQPKIIHRDLKPQNVLLDKEGFAKICDFGVSKFKDGANTTNVSYGTVEYMSPEMLVQSTNYNETVDVYSFGIMMHEMFTEKRPYRNDDEIFNPFALGMKVINGTRLNIPFSVYPVDRSEEGIIISFFNKSNTLECTISTDEVTRIVRKYFELCVQCWDTNATNRPPFDEIARRLQDLNSIFSSE
jgi:tRNA A-37 threonylcarbamoyl transferase component Bud32